MFLRISLSNLPHQIPSDLMPFRLVLILLLSCHLSSYGQTKLLLKNTRTGRQKEIVRNNFIKISFSTTYEKVKVYHEGKVVSFTDSTLSYLPRAYTIPFFSRQKDTVTIALRNIIAIQKYRPVVNLALLAGAGVGAGIAAASVSKNAFSDVLIIYGAFIVFRLAESRLVYPMRKVNRKDGVWQLVIRE